MKPGVLADVFHRQLVPRLVAGNGFVFGAVVAEHPLDLLHPGDQVHIGQENPHLEDALNQDPDPPAQFHKMPQRCHHQGGQDGEEQNGSQAAHHGRAGQEDFLGFFTQMLPHPFFKGGLLFFLVVVVPHADLGRIHHIPIAHNQALDHGHGPPHNGDLHPALADRHRVGLGLNLAVRLADGTADQLGAPHHDAFHQCLASYTGLETFFLCVLVHWS